jgi:hypothetical protein
MCRSFTLNMPNHSSMSSTQFEAASSPCSTFKTQISMSHFIKHVNSIINNQLWETWGLIKWSSIFGSVLLAHQL